MRKFTYRAKVTAHNINVASSKGIASILFDEMTAGLVIRIVSLLK